MTAVALAAPTGIWLLGGGAGDTPVAGATALPPAPVAAATAATPPAPDGKAAPAAGNGVPAGQAVSPRPRPRSIAAARHWAAGRKGEISFAIVGSDGSRSFRRPKATYPAASVAKVIVMIAELDRLARNGKRPDAATREAMAAMITYSDNDAATLLYERIGDRGMERVARRAGLRDFEIHGHWGASRVSARDMVRLMDRLPRLVPARHLRFANNLLAGIIPEQRWGIAAVTDGRWKIRFKGGWLPESGIGPVVHQVATLRRGNRRVSLAILTAGSPSYGYAVGTIEGIAAILFPRPAQPPPP